MAKQETRRSCELCEDAATVYCPCDTAFLCDNCDDRVHRANFLVARHVRVEICRTCRHFAGNRISGVAKPSPPCESCSPALEATAAAEYDNDCVSSTSSSCVSFTSSSASSSRRTRRRTTAVDTKVEGILVNWCRKMEIDENNNKNNNSHGSHRNVVRLVVEILSKCVGKMTILPFRVLLAAAFWAVIRTRGGGELARLEQISGVPGQLIVATESRLTRVVKKRKLISEDYEEGWAES